MAETARYSIYLEDVSAAFDVATLKPRIDKFISMRMLTYSFGLISRSVKRPNIILVELATEASRDQLNAILAGFLGTGVPLRVKAIDWGWIASDSSRYSTAGTSAVETQPYASIEPQAEPDRVYRYKPQALLVSVALGVVALGLLALGVMQTSGGRADAGTGLGFMAILVGGMACLAFVTIATRVQCTADSLIVFGLFSGERRIHWSDASTMEIIHTRGKKCHVSDTLLDVSFEIDDLHPLPGRDTLIKTTIVRSGLLYVSTTPTTITFKRPQSNLWP